MVDTHRKARCRAGTRLGSSSLEVAALSTAVNSSGKIHRAGPGSLNSRCVGNRRVRSDPGNLTPREIELLSLLEEGLRNRQIAQRLHITLDTVKTHFQNIYLKLETKSRLAVVHRTE